MGSRHLRFADTQGRDLPGLEDIADILRGIGIAARPIIAIGELVARGGTEAGLDFGAAGADPRNAEFGRGEPGRRRIAGAIGPGHGFGRDHHHEFLSTQRIGNQPHGKAVTIVAKPGGAGEAIAIVPQRAAERFLHILELGRLQLDAERAQPDVRNRCLCQVRLGEVEAIAVNGGADAGQRGGGGRRGEDGAGKNGGGETAHLELTSGWAPEDSWTLGEIQ